MKRRAALAACLIASLIAACAPLQARAQTQPDQAMPIGNVATLQGNATVSRNSVSTALKAKDDIFKNDILQTAANSSLSVTFDDATTFNLNANARIVVDNYVYEDGGKSNAAIFNVARGTVAFVASAVAKTGDMKITTPTATLGIRGTTGLVEVPDNAASGTTNDVAIKLYPDPDGRVGRIEVNGRDGVRLGLLTQGASGFAIRPGAGGARFAAVALQISPQQAARDQGFVRQVHAAQSVGRQIVTQQKALRPANPARSNPQRQPGQLGQPKQAPPSPNRLNQTNPAQPTAQPPRAPSQPPAAQQPRTPAQQLQRPGQQRPFAPRRQPAPAKGQKQKRI